MAAFDTATKWVTAHKNKVFALFSQNTLVQPPKGRTKENDNAKDSPPIKLPSSL